MQKGNIRDKVKQFFSDDMICRLEAYQEKHGYVDVLAVITVLLDEKLCAMDYWNEF